MPNPLDYLSQAEIDSLELTEEELAESYQPSSGGVFHWRGGEGLAKTLGCVHHYRYLIDEGIYLPEEGYGNLTIKGKYGKGFTTIKGEDLREFLWEMTHKPYEHKIAIIDEIDSEFPARAFTEKDQTEIALRLWHIQKLGNVVMMTSHLGNSTDVIMHLATHYNMWPTGVNWEANSFDVIVEDRLHENAVSIWTAHDVIKTMLLYSRRELTEASDRYKPRPKKAKSESEIEVESERGEIELPDSFNFPSLDTNY